MLQFLKYVLASMVGILLLVVLLVIIAVGIASTVGKSRSDTVEANSILKISFTKSVEDKSQTSVDPYTVSFTKTLGLREILSNIRAAAKDDKIKGIFLDITTFPGGFASLEELRNGLVDFKKSKKIIYTYGENLTEKGYYLASVSDKIYLNPQGILEFNGLSTEYSFYKGALDKLGIEVQVFRVGKFKSFVEPYTLDKMSIANRTQVQSYLGSLFTSYMKGISVSRKIPLDSLIQISNELKIREAPEALKYHLVDGLKYKDEVLEEFKTLTGSKSLKDIPMVSLSDYDKSEEGAHEGGEKISLIYASGDIAGGEGSNKTIGSERLSRTIREARLNKDVKAIVLRVNSPGGGSVASDIIWREVYLAQKVKPVVVSMGDVAASGGYYIACAAGKIFAEPNTITGSIGIFALIPNTEKFFNDKLGITFDRVNTGKYSDIVTVTRALKEDEKAIIQHGVNTGYQDFLHRVADGRHKKVSEIDSIAQGRVWTGEQALKIGLVDQMGGLEEAIQEAAKEARLKSFRVVSEHDSKNMLESILSGGMDEIRLGLIKKELGANFPTYEALKTINAWSGFQARLPFSPSTQ